MMGVCLEINVLDSLFINDETFWRLTIFLDPQLKSGFPGISRISLPKMAQKGAFFEIFKPLFGLNYVPMVIAHVPKVY